MGRELGAAFSLLLACSGESSAPVTPPPSRVVAVTAQTNEAESVDTFCEAQGADFDWPSAVEGETPASSGWRWVNVWATWCRPCVEEMPRLQSFRDRLRAENIDIELVFLSADAEASAVAEFHEQHPDHPTGPRATDLEALRAWFAQLGLDEGAPLPVQLFVKPDGKLACARTAAISDDDYASVKSLLEG